MTDFEMCPAHGTIQMALDDIRKDTAEIKTALIGTFDRRGLIGEVKESNNEFREDITNLKFKIQKIEDWKDEAERSIRITAVKWVGYLVAALAAGGGVGMWIEKVTK